MKSDFKHAAAAFESCERSAALRIRRNFRSDPLGSMSISLTARSISSLNRLTIDVLSGAGHRDYSVGPRPRGAPHIESTTTSSSWTA